jgi:hypothetical protein|uniref:Uncharacterized protein n=1 Tax=Siphoviridae sp. ctvBz3 TaxID=2825720 RepID=A0A8S5TXJ8_9CAUD|nr:MAG TPA: hypothetical protein [Siphoviridae sp. ctvBz3]
MSGNIQMYLYFRPVPYGSGLSFILIRKSGKYLHKCEL